MDKTVREIRLLFSPLVRVNNIYFRLIINFRIFKGILNTLQYSQINICPPVLKKKIESFQSFYYVKPPYIFKD